MDPQIVLSAVFSRFPRQSALSDVPQQGFGLAGAALPGYWPGRPIGLPQRCRTGEGGTERYEHASDVGLAGSPPVLRTRAQPEPDQGLVIARNSRSNAGLVGPDHGQRRRQDKASSLASGSTVTTLILASKARV